MGGPGGLGGGRPPAAMRELMEQGRLPGGRPPFGGPPDGTAGSMPPGGAAGARFGPPGGGGPGGPGGEVDAKLISYLEAHRDGATWLAAVSSAQSAAPIIVKTGLPVIAMGGFTGSDPAMTVPKLQAYVSAGKLHYVLTGGGGGPGGGGSSAVTSWVAANCTAVKASEYGGTATTQNAQTVYRCG